MKKHLLRLWLFLILLALPLCARADEPVLGTAQADLYTAGKFPTPSMTMAIDFDVSAFNDVVYAGLSSQEEKIDVSSFGLSIDAFRSAYGELVNAHPELFYVSSNYRYGHLDGVVVYLLPEYLYTGEDLQTRIAAFNAAVSRAAAYAGRASTRVGKLLMANIYFCLNFEYDTSLTNYSPDLLFSTGKGVCQAYMLAFSAVLNQLGIANTPATSTAMKHTWNLVQVDGNWYHIDVTWNDPVGSMPLNVHYNNFLLSHSGIMSTGHHSWAAQVSASSTKYDNAFWREMTMPLPFSGSTVYYVACNPDTFTCAVRAHDLGSGSDTELFSYDVPYIIGGGGFDPLWVSGGRAYYTTGQVLASSALDGSDLRVEYVCSAPGEKIWRLYMDNGTLSMFVSTGPYDSGAVLPLTAQDIRITFPAPMLEMNVWENQQLIPQLNGTDEYALPISLTISDPELLGIDAYGWVIPYAPGVASVGVTVANLSADYSVLLHSADVLTLPADTASIETEAFTQTSAQEIILPEGITAVGERAFADCENLILATLPATLESIAPTAFAGNDALTLLCAPGSAAEAFAAGQNIPVFLLPE